MSRDPYDVLGVPRSASQSDIKKAYRALARKHHPDANPDNRKGSEGRFKEINAAFEAIGEPEQRKLFDQFGHDATRPGFNVEQARAYQRMREQPMGTGGFGPFNFNVGGDGGFEDLFEVLRGGGGGAPRARRVPREEPETILDLDLETALRGGEVSLTVRQPRPCERCGGASGAVRPCQQCSGRGVVSSERELKVRVPARIPDGVRLRIPSDGGDLVVTVRILPHEHVGRDGHDLVVELPITVSEAILGGNATLTLPDGSCARVKIPKGSPGGRKLRLKGLGLGKDDHRGDLYAVLQIRVPEEQSPELTRLALALAALYRDEVVSPVRKSDAHAV